MFHVQGNVTYYCYSRQAGGVCPQATAADIQGFQSGMAACFQKAIDLGLSTIAVAPHLDDGLGYGEAATHSSSARILILHAHLYFSMRN